MDGRRADLKSLHRCQQRDGGQNRAMPCDCDPVGAVEIATRLGVSRRTVDQWRQRYADFPAPRWQIGGRPAWDWADLTPWLEATHRTPPA